MKLPEKWLHIGTSHLQAENFLPIKNDPILPKPYGGIWASPLEYNSDYNSDWDRFSKTAMKREHKGSGVIFDFKRHTRFFIINSQEDLIRLINKVGIAKSQIPYLRPIIADYENACNYYDVIYLTSEGQAKTRTPLANYEYNLYGWDVESCIILNPSVIKNQLTVSI